MIDCVGDNRCTLEHDKRDSYAHTYTHGVITDHTHSLHMTLVALGLPLNII